jgi:HK97 family phage major capsid protein
MYTRETGFTNNAATVSESDQKPESNLTFTLMTAAIVTLAHWIRCSTQVLSDNPMLQAYIEGGCVTALRWSKKNSY